MWNRCDTCHPRGTCRCGHALLLKFPDIFQGHLHVQSVQEPTLEVTVSRAPRARKGCNWCTIRRIFPTVSTQARVHSGSKSNGHGGGGASWSIKEMGWSECSPPIAWLHPGISPQDEEFGGQRPGLPSEQSRIWIAPPPWKKAVSGGSWKSHTNPGGRGGAGAAVSMQSWLAPPPAPSTDRGFSQVAITAFLEVGGKGEGKSGRPWVLAGCTLLVPDELWVSFTEHN